MGEISVKTGNNARNGGKNSLNRLIRLFAGKKSAQIREILISESAWEEMTCLFAPSLEDYRLQVMIKKSAFIDVITFKQWRDLNERGVLINLPTHLFHFEVESL
ncbi:hypothetical protein [Klebsiella quasipneumoniae]|uniref:hypothetical protein n=1 Tax=Klebsiella quasipneumoniae TaxID=1463165 RepID=UPI0016049758|nr:hypothetical protein [Klebsiella quasipneumoniae]